jgi:hypothetical protein
LEVPIHEGNDSFFDVATLSDADAISDARRAEELEVS